MASPAHTTRRSLFAIAGATALLPAAALAGTQARATEWDRFAEKVGALDPELEKSARAAEAAGWHPSELCLIYMQAGHRPFLQFQRKVNEQFQSAGYPGVN